MVTGLRVGQEHLVKDADLWQQRVRLAGPGVGALAQPDELPTERLFTEAEAHVRDVGLADVVTARTRKVVPLSQPVGLRKLAHDCAYEFF